MINFTISKKQEWLSSLCWPTQHGEDNDWTSWIEWHGFGCTYLSHVTLYKESGQLKTCKDVLISFLCLKLHWSN